MTRQSHARPGGGPDQEWDTGYQFEHDGGQWLLTVHWRAFAEDVFVERVELEAANSKTWRRSITPDLWRAVRLGEALERGRVETILRARDQAATAPATSLLDPATGERPLTAREVTSVLDALAMPPKTRHRGRRAEWDYQAAADLYNSALEAGSSRPVLVVLEGLTDPDGRTLSYPADYHRVRGVVQQARKHGLIPKTTEKG